MEVAAGHGNLSRYVGKLVSIATDPTSLRGLTDKERQALEYIYRTALPGVRGHAENKRSLAETLAAIGIVRTKQLAYGAWVSALSGLRFSRVADSE